MSEDKTGGNKDVARTDAEAAELEKQRDSFYPEVPGDKPGQTVMRNQKMANIRALADGNPNATALEQEGSSFEVVEVRTGMFGTDDFDTSGYGGLQRAITRPAGSVPPYGEWYDDAVAILEEKVPGAIETVIVDHDGLTLHVSASTLLDLAWVLRDDPRLRFEMCLSVSGVHFPADEGRELAVMYHLLSQTHKRRIRLQTAVSEADPHVASVVRVYPAADWHERETWDMFGVIFDGHPALTRILMPDDWPGHPQRKDYPLGGVPVEYKGATIAPPDERRSYSK